MSAPIERLRARDLNILIGIMSPGPHNAITDVPGVRVGHVSLIRGSGKLIPGQGPVPTGVTAILVEGDEAVAAAIHTINGIGYVTSAEIVREMGRLRGPVMLTGTRNVRVVADAVQDWGLRAIGPGVSPWQHLRRLQSSSASPCSSLFFVPSSDSLHRLFVRPACVPRLQSNRSRSMAPAFW